MAHRGRRTADDALAARLAGGETVQAAAAAAGVAVRTAHRRLAEPEFQERVAELRRQAVAAAIGALTEASTAAARRLARLVESADERVALGAAKATLELTLKAVDVPALERRVAELEKLHSDRGGNDGGLGAARLEDFHRLYEQVRRERGPVALTDEQLAAIAGDGR